MQTSFSAPTGRSASTWGRCVTASPSVRTNRMNSSVQRQGVAVPNSVKTGAGVCPRPSCATQKRTVRTAVMKKTVVGPTFD